MEFTQHPLHVTKFHQLSGVATKVSSHPKIYARGLFKVRRWVEEILNINSRRLASDV